MDEIQELEKELDDISVQINEQRKKNENLRKKIAQMQSSRAHSPVDDERVHFNDSLVYNEMVRRGIALKYIPHTDLIEARFASHKELLVNATSRFIPYVDALILEDKFNTKQLLKEWGYPVAEGMIFDSIEINEALAYAREQLNYPVVIKPTKGSGGNFVFCNIQTDSDFRRAYSSLSKVTIHSILVEKHISKVEDYRFFIINGKVVSVVKRTPPYIVGNGQSTIKQLVEAENYRRMNPRDTCLCPIQIDDFESERCLNSQKVTCETILAIGQTIQCRFNSNVSMGGECETVKHQVHPSYFEIATNISQLFPNLAVFVIDLLIQDLFKEAIKDSYLVCECCCINPGLSLHTHPSKGEKDDIITPLIDLLFPETMTK